MYSTNYTFTATTLPENAKSTGFATALSLSLGMNAKKRRIEHKVAPLAPPAPPVPPPLPTVSAKPGVITIDHDDDLEDGDPIVLLPTVPNQKKNKAPPYIPVRKLKSNALGTRR